MLGTNGYSGFISSGGGSGPPGTGGFASFKQTCGVGSGPVDGQLTWTFASLIGATQFTTININNSPQTVDVDFTFNPGTGTITRPFAWVTGDVVTGGYQPA